MAWKGNWIVPCRFETYDATRDRDGLAHNLEVAAERRLACGWFREAAYDRPRAYSYRVARSIPPFDHEGGTLTFTPSTDGTHVDWQTSYTHPAHAGGKLMEAISRPLLR